MIGVYILADACAVNSQQEGQCKQNNVHSSFRFDSLSLSIKTVQFMSYIDFSTISPIIAHCLKKVTKCPDSNPHQPILLVAKCVPKTLAHINQPWLY